VVDVSHVRVSHSDASRGRTVTAYDSDDPDSTTVNWVFSDSPKWGDEITWTGAASTSWNLADNWDPVRVPLAGDRVTIPGDATRMPEITTFGAEVLALTLEAGASLRSLGVALTVSNDVTLAAGASLFLSNGTFTAHADVRQTAGGSFGLMDASLSVASNLLFAADGTVAFTRAAVDVAGAWTNAASVTCEASSLRVAGVFANPGTLAFAGATRQTLELSRDADFTGGTLAAGVSTVRLAGSVAQTVSPDGVTFDQLTVRKGGGSLRFTDGFSVNSFDVRESGALPIAFAAGEKVTVADLVWRDASLASTAPGTQWLLEVTSAQSALDVTVHDSDARSGLTIYTNGKEPADGNNLGWEFETFFQSWVGGSATDWNNAANWSPAGIPGPTSRVTVVSSAATIVSTVPVTVRGLSVGGDASTAAVTFREAFYCEDSLDVRNRGTVTLNKPSAVTNNVSVRTGGTLTHEQITSTLTKAGQEDKRLDLVCGGDFLVEEGGKVAADGKGFASGKGPSKCYSGGNSRYQACHGGAAQRGYAYGSITAPTNCGSGVASTGGGAIKVFAGGDLRVDGTVTADGNAGSGWQSSAGGSVWLKGRRLIGNGTLAARGGWVSVGPTGSGGRIAVWLSVADGSLPGWSGQITAAGGACTWMTAAGTVYLSGAGEGATNGTLVVDNAGLADGISEAGPSLGLDSVRDVVATNGGRVAFLQNETTSLRGNVYTSGGSNALAGVGATVDLTGPADATIRTEGTFGNVTCTEPGKRIFVSTEPGYHLGLATNATLTLRGGKENPIVLRAAPDPDVEWILHLRAGCQTDVKYVAVSNSNASSGNSVLALDSRDEGGNKNWGFSAEINPGDPITWNGSQGISWGTADNWTDRAGGHRTPRGTDHVIIPGELSAYPVLTATEGTFTANRLTVEDGGALTLSGAGLIVTNALSVSGTLTVSGTETVDLSGNATFARAASFAAGSGRVRLSGDGSQTVDFAGASFVVLEVRKSGGGVTFTGSLTADRFDALTENAVYLAFSRNVTATANSFFCRGRQGTAAGTAALVLRGSVQGEKWNLAVRARQYVSGVWVRDSSATGLEMAADALSENGGDNFRWTFGASRAEWTGAADTVFTNAANWYPAVSPGATTEAMIFAPAGVTCTVRAGTPVTLAGLTVGTAGLGNGTIDFRAVAPITVNGDVSVGAGATLTLDSALTNNVVAGNLTMFAGGTLTHSAGKTTEQYALRLEVGGDVAVPTGAVITAMGKGYYQSGPGRIIGTDNNHVPSAVYGGSSMNEVRYSYAPPYGSVFEPVRYGSGGSGTGGGINRLFLGGVLTVGGVIASEGEYVNAWGSNGGGSVWVKAKRLVGDGTFSVNGSYAPGHGPGAAGGRLCVELADREPLTDWTGTMTSRAVPDGLKAYGHLGAGTVLVRTGRGTSVLSIDNGLDATTGQDVTDLPAPDDSPRRSYRKTSVVVRDGGWLRVAGDVTVADLDLASANTKVMLETNTLTVLTSAHRDGRGWHPDAQVTCTTNATTGAYGKIVWRQPGTLVIVR